MLQLAGDFYVRPYKYKLQKPHSQVYDNMDTATSTFLIPFPSITIVLKYSRMTIINKTICLI